ncbi:MAG TPA: acetyl-CoA carboxylase carboxyltransferase subunit beta [Candidatus Alectryocaccobium stercorigallinarum]|nr:acetyl-CoA carboxylase carboxyltransferase subunit beta [Candidatus Alectryocaccobium stercorigallinarum]
MSLQDLFAENKIKYKNLVGIRKNIKKENGFICPKCHNESMPETLQKKNYICSYCGYLFKMPPRARIELICDKKKFREYQSRLTTKDPLEFPGYQEKLEGLREQTGEMEAVVTGVAAIKDVTFALAVMNSAFLMGSMGTVVGEKITALTEYAERKHIPLVIFAASGGARMQEGLFSLMQMAKTAAAVEKFKRSGGLYISCLTNPTTGGVSASFAMLGDIIIAEPEALICFAGPRVIEQTIGRTLPEGFQRSEFLLEHGMIDMICERRKLKDTLYKIMKLHMPVESPAGKGNV